MFDHVMDFGLGDDINALREMVRVLRKTDASRVCILEFSLPDGSSMLSKAA